MQLVQAGSTAGTRPSFSATSITTTVATTTTGQTYVANADITDTLVVSAGDLISLGFSNGSPGFSNTFTLGTIEATLQFN